MPGLSSAMPHLTVPLPLQPAARDLLDQLMFLRVLITWLWNLVSFQLAETQGGCAQPRCADPPACPPACLPACMGGGALWMAWDTCVCGRHGED